MVFAVGVSKGAMWGSVKSKMAADVHLEMTALSRVTLASARLSCYINHQQYLVKMNVLSQYVYMCIQ